MTLTKAYIKRITLDMVMHLKRVPKRTIVTSGDKRIQSLLDVLNHKGPLGGDTKLRKDTLDLLRDLMVLHQLLRKNRQAFRREKGPHVEVFQRINELLCRCKAFPMILNSYQYGRPNSRGWETAWFWTGEPMEECAEIELFLTALEIAQTGQINMLKMCQQCDKCLLARVSSQKFCSEECRNQFHMFNEADKDRRAAWAREKYKSSKVTES